MTTWEEAKKRSKYHFDNFKNDKMVDKIDMLGRLVVETGSISDHADYLKELFGCEKQENRIAWLGPTINIPLQIDDLTNICEDHWRIAKVIVHLNDWEPGQFFSFGNYIHTQWRAGDTFTYDWQNLPYSIANASHGPIRLYQMTGIITEKYLDFTNRLKRFSTYALNPV